MLSFDIWEDSDLGISIRMVEGSATKSQGKKPIGEGSDKMKGT